MRKVIVGIVVAAVLGLALPAVAVVFVSPNGDDSLPGGSWAKAKLTIQAGIDAAAAKGGDVVRVMTGTYDGGILLKNGVTLRGGFSGNAAERDIVAFPSVIDAGQLGGALKVLPGATAVIDGIEFDNGSASYGGAINVMSGNLTVKNSSFYFNNADRSGGAIYALNSDLVVTKCTFDQNACGLYGGAICASRGQTSVTGSTFTANDAHCGAAFDSDYAVASEFSYNAVEGNTADYGGGVSFRWKSDVTALNNIITDNEAAYGGGMYIYYSNAPVANSLIARNYASAKGGGIYWGSYCVATAINNTIVANSASQGGGVCALYKTVGWVANSIFKGNSASEGGAAFKDVWSSLDLYYCCISQNGLSQLAGGVTASTLNGNIYAAPLFVNYAAGDYHLQTTSKCIDAGDDAVVDPAWTDLDGNPRQVGTVDIGCYEVQ